MLVNPVVLERGTLDAGKAVSEVDVSQAAASTERKVPNISDTVGQRQVSQAAALERIVSDAGDTVWNDNIG